MIYIKIQPNRILFNITPDSELMKTSNFNLEDLHIKKTLLNRSIMEKILMSKKMRLFQLADLPFLECFHFT